MTVDPRHLEVWERMGSAIDRERILVRNAELIFA